MQLATEKSSGGRARRRQGVTTGVNAFFLSDRLIKYLKPLTNPGAIGEHRSGKSVNSCGRGAEGLGMQGAVGSFTNPCSDIGGANLLLVIVGRKLRGFPKLIEL